MNYEVIWSDAAIADLHDLCTHIARDNPAASGAGGRLTDPNSEVRPGRAEAGRPGGHRRGSRGSSLLVFTSNFHWCHWMSEEMGGQRANGEPGAARSFSARAGESTVHT